MNIYFLKYLTYLTDYCVISKHNPINIHLIYLTDLCVIST